MKVLQMLYAVTAAGLVLQSLAARAADAPATNERSDQGYLEEIVVTAQRREENLQKVPISVTAITAKSLAASGITSNTLIPQIVPSVQLGRSGPSGIFFVRGVGNTSGGAGEEGANALYVDGVYLADQYQGVLKFNNIERVEVLKGPQGTLFGRNASGGLINVITKEPGDKFVATGQMGYANYKTYSGQFYVAVPVTEKVSADIAFQGSDQRDGWGRNLFDGTQTNSGWDWGLRSKILWHPSDTVKIVFAGDYSDLRDTFTTSYRLLEGSVGIGRTVSAGGYNVNTSDPEHNLLQKAWGESLTAELDFRWAKLTSITAFREYKIRASIDADGAQLPLVRTTLPAVGKSFQQEVRLASTVTGPLNWQLGVFLLRGTTDVTGQGNRGLAFGGVNAGYDIIERMKTESYAGFGEIGYNLTSSTHLIVGTRFTRDDRQLHASQVPVGFAVGTPRYNAFNLPPRDDSLTYGKFTYRAAIRQDITDNVNVYTSYNRGFKAGGWALSSPADPAVRPQFIDAYEIGLKSEVFDRRLRLNFAAFHYDISDYQVRATPNIGISPKLLNAASVKVDGFEAQFDAAPTRSIRLFGGLTLLKSKFSSFLAAPYTFPNPAVCTPGGTPPGHSTGAPVGGDTTCIGSAKGNYTPLAPKSTANIGGSYTFDIVNTGDLSLSAMYSYNDGYYFESDNRIRQKAYSIVNGSLEYQATKLWAIELWGKNLTNEKYSPQALGTALGDLTIVSPPRTYGLNVKFSFD